MIEKKETTQMGGAYAHPGVNPAAVRYAQEMAARKGGDPVAGGPTPPIPRLDQPHQDGRTMSDTARAQRGDGGGGSTIVEPPRSAATAMDPASPAPFLLPTDLLPEQAQQDPLFRSGTGAMYAAAQPHLAAKYGVIRRGEHVPPQRLSAKPGEAPKQGKLRAETVDGIKKIAEAQERAVRGEIDEEAEAGSRSGPAGAAVGVGGQDHPPISEADLKSALSNMDDLDLEQVREMMTRDLFNNENQRKIIEGRLEPMLLSNLVMNGFVTQRVPIVLGEYEPTFRSLAGDDDLECKRLIVEEARQVKVDDRYLLDKYAFMGLTCSLFAMNGVPYPDHLDKDGNFDEAKFRAKFKKIMKSPLPMLASLCVHYFWFDVRVRKLFVAQEVKNG